MPKNLVRNGIAQITLQTVRKYVFISFKKSMVTFLDLFIFKRSSNNGLSRPRKADVRASKPILPPFAQNENAMELKVFFLEIAYPNLNSGKV